MEFKPFSPYSHPHSVVVGSKGDSIGSKALFMRGR